MRQKKEPLTKNCLHCGQTVTQPRWANGKLDSTFAQRKFCSTICAGFRKTDKPTAGRKRAQRLTPLVQCNKCKSTARLQRHHKDRNPMNNEQKNIEVLCQTCHTQDHLMDKTWGRGERGGKTEYRALIQE